MDGQQAESIACQYLKEARLKINQRNYHTQRGEIDIIARDGDTVVFVEVRYRNSSTYGSAEESINHRKQQRIIHAAQAWLQEHRLTESTVCRFDTVCISPSTDSQSANNSSPLPYRVEWLRNAFCV